MADSQRLAAAELARSRGGFIRVTDEVPGLDPSIVVLKRPDAPLPRDAEEAFRMVREGRVVLIRDIGADES